MEKVILVDENDIPIGEMEKMQVHEEGLLHRALSVIVFNSKGEMLIQQRALTKYHTPGKWSNTCCSHPRPGENGLNAATRRLQEEMGFEANLQKKFDFIYKAHFDNGLIEHEFDHVFFGTYDGFPVINPEEAHDYKWIDVAHLIEDMQNEPEKYTIWFRIIMKEIELRVPELYESKNV